MKDKYDVVIIGSGLGGLACGVILAKEGLSVCILEKNRQIGGNLQTFSRDKKIFDTGVHYIGGLDKGQNLHSIFSYLGIMDQLKISRMDMETFDVVSLPGQPERGMAQTYEIFRKKLYDEFPKEKAAIDSYCGHMVKACDSFPLYRLIGEKENVFETSYVGVGARDLIASLTSDKQLQNVLAGSNFLYEGLGESTPFYVHALVVNSYIESSWRMVNGGSQIAIELTKELRKHGGDIFKRVEVIEILSGKDDGMKGGKDEKVRGVRLKDGEVIEAKYVISNLHPAKTMELTNSSVLKPLYRKRISGLENTLSAFSAHLVLKEGYIPYFNRNYYDYFVDDVWKTVRPFGKSPAFAMISTSPHSVNPEWTDNITVMCYMDIKEVRKWEDTFNTTLEPGVRSAEYEEWKLDKIDAIVDLLERRFPNIRQAILSKYASTPLSYRDYIGTADGSMYGVRRDFRHPERSFIGPKTKLENLLLTGQNLSHLHGVLGVSIAAISTCSEIVGLEYLCGKIRLSTEN